jgi:hypothetical protein
MSDRTRTIAANKIRTFVKKNIHKFIIRDTGNIENRIINNNKIIENFAVSDSKPKNYCMNFDKIDDIEKTPIFTIKNNGNDVILEQQIGSASVNGIIYKSKFKNDDDLSFATKVIIGGHGRAGEDNEHELNVLKILSKLVLEGKCPHFPILFKTLRCLKFNTILDENDEEFDYYPDLITNNLDEEFMFLFNELANGDLKSFMRINFTKTALIQNALAQVFLSLMFFYHYTGNIHADAHWGNFLFHKIKPGGYFHYNILGVDYYVENLGYLWVIWDFSRSVNYIWRQVMDTDFIQIINAFYNDKKTFPRSHNELDGFVSRSNKMDETFKNSIVSMFEEIFVDISKRPASIKSNLSYTPKRMEIYMKWILSILVKNNFLLTSISPDHKLINSTPYTIEYIQK